VGLELVREADYILNACGRPTPPPGVKFVDLPRMLSYLTVYNTPPETTVNISPRSERVQNKANTLLIVEGLSMSGGPFRIKWPSGRTFSQNFFEFPGTVIFSPYPSGRGATQFKLPRPEPIPADGRITIESNGGCQVDFWGKLRYLVRDAGPRRGAVCTIKGYPAEARELAGAVDLATIPNPVQALENLPPYPSCIPNGNIMAPEYLVGNQCTPETPAGFRDEAFSFRTPSVTVVENALAVSNPVVVIPGNDLVVLRRIRPISVWNNDDTSSAIVSFSMRTPSGYSVTGGDLISTGQSWYYFFPELVMRAGERITFDVSNFNSVTPGVGTITTYFEIEGVKRRRIL
jgi:hypothetical protein